MQVTDNDNQFTSEVIPEFKGLLSWGIKKYSPKNFFQTWVFKSSLPVSIILTALAVFSQYYFQCDGKIVELLEVFIPLSLQITITLAALSLAGMAILVTTEADSKFVKFLSENDLYKEMLFLFAEPLFIVIINLFTATISLFVVYTGIVLIHCAISILLVFINGLVSLYTTLTFINLYNVYTMYGQERCHYYTLIEADEKNTSEMEG